MNFPFRWGALVVLLVLSTACEGSGPSSPTEEPRLGGGGSLPAPPPASPPPSTSFPPLSGPSRTFVFHSELSYPVSSYTKRSNFVLYDNGAFVLRYLDLAVEYRGQYTDANGVIAFLDFGGGANSATGTLEGDLLTVRWSEIAQHSDFEDAVYVLMP